MTTPTGTISLNDIQTEFNGANPIGINEYYAGAGYVPSGIGVPGSGQISFNDLRGKSAATYSIIISSNTSNFDMRASAIALGWNGTSSINFTVTINPSIVVYSTSTSSYAFYISPNFPAGSSLTLNNNGIIIGAGGLGGAGGTGTQTGSSGGAGGAGGPALYAGYGVTIYNSIIYGGGGGGGGGGGSVWLDSQFSKSYISYTGGAGGNGAGTNGSTSATAGQPKGTQGGNNSGSGGNGGAVGVAGVTGGVGTYLGSVVPGGGGGAPGSAIAGVSNVFWLNYGTVIGTQT